MHVVGGPFDCWAMKDYLIKNYISLRDLPCDQITSDLVAYEIISDIDKRSMMDGKSQMGRALDNIRSSLYYQQPKMFKSFLLVLEQSGNAVLIEAAKKLG